MVASIQKVLPSRYEVNAHTGLVVLRSLACMSPQLAGGVARCFSGGVAKFTYLASVAVAHAKKSTDASIIQQ